MRHMDADDVSDRLARAARKLDRLEAAAHEQVERERQGHAPDEGALSRPLLELRGVAEDIESLLDERRDWVAGSLELERLAAVGVDNLTVAGLSLQRAEAAAGDIAAPRLHLLCDAVFHLRRCLNFLQRLDAEAVDDTRRVDRVENRREFLSG